ncbi:MAG: uroporphyrinogen decarboxylase family protein [Phycisphaerae bacterium]
MTSRDRIIAALAGRLPDRAPITIYEMSHLAADAWYLREPSCRPLLDAQRNLGDSIVMTGLPVMRFLDDPNAVRDSSKMVGRSTVITRTLRTPKGDLTAVSRRDPGVATTWQLKAYIESPDDARKFLSLPVEPYAVDVSGLKAQIERAGDEGLVNVSLGDTLGYVVSLFHYDRFAMMLVDDEPLVMELMRVTYERLRQGLAQACRQVRGVAFRFWGPEYAGPSLLHPRYFRKLVVDFLAPLIEMVNQSGNYSIVHCHGRLDAILEMIAEMRPHALEPLEVLPAVTADVAMADIKRRIGARVCLMGGVQASELETRPAEYVTARVREIMLAAKDGGRYVMLPTGGPIRTPVPPEVVRNYQAYFAAGREFGGY